MSLKSFNREGRTCKGPEVAANCKDAIVAGGEREGAGSGRQASLGLEGYADSAGPVQHCERQEAARRLQAYKQDLS